jgi:hypothetical protein
MRKISLLFLALASSSAMYAQKNVANSNKVGHGKATVAQDISYPTSGVQSTFKKTRKVTEALSSSFGTKQVVGNTSYDLQSNGSQPRRIMQNGTNLSCYWTHSTEQGVTSTSAFADRGTGYASFNGTSWSVKPTAKLESIRTGFGNVVKDGAGNEMYIVHDGAANKLYINKKVGGAWQPQVDLGTSTVHNAIWPHAATSGNWLYVVASSSDTSNNPQFTSNGIRNGYFLSRSNNNGNTWIDNMIPMPLIDSVGHYRGGGNSYSIAARDSFVAVLFGDAGTDLTLLKSSNYGATWTKKVLIDWPVDNFNFGSATLIDVDGNPGADTIGCSDGSHSIVIGNNGLVHVVTTMEDVIKDGTTAGFSFFNNTRIWYFTDTTTNTVQELDNAFLFARDCDEDSTIDIPKNYTGPTATSPDAAYNTIGTLTQPTMSIDPASNNLVIAYTAIVENDSTDDAVYLGSSTLPGQPYRDVCMMVSKNGGTSWSFPFNISRTQHFEEAFPSLPEYFTGSKITVLYQGDIEPGTILQNEDIYDPTWENLLIAQTVDIDDIATLAATDFVVCDELMDLPLGLNNDLSLNNGIVSIYPNPATDKINLNIELTNTSKEVNVEITDMTGKVVYTTTLKNVLNNKYSINTSSFANGMYIVKVSTDNDAIARKFTKE